VITRVCRSILVLERKDLEIKCSEVEEVGGHACVT